MGRSRLSAAIDEGSFIVPDIGAVAVFGAPPDYDLSELADCSVNLVSPFRPWFDAWSQRRVAVAADPPESASAAIIVLPRERRLARAWIVKAIRLLPEGGPIWIDGHKKDGVDAVLKECRSIFEIGTVISLAHGKIFGFSAGPLPDDWSDAPRRVAARFLVPPGSFSADAIDPGSAALVEVLPHDLAGSVADLGSGWGYLSAEIIASTKLSEIHLFDANHDALAASRENVNDARAQFHWADVPNLPADPRFDAVVTNPPFHTGRKGDPELGRAFIRAASQILKPAGSLWLVANRHLPYESALDEGFGRVELVNGAAGFKVFHATRPRRR
ncbi:MAG: class I SAM-dependent methyltransferase [Pseudomonadota bacterium]